MQALFKCQLFVLPHKIKKRLLVNIIILAVVSKHFKYNNIQNFYLILYIDQHVLVKIFRIVFKIKTLFGTNSFNFIWFNFHQQQQEQIIILLILIMSHLNSYKGLSFHSPTNRPQDQLQFISMTQELVQRFSPEKKITNKMNIQPWQDEQQNPSQSPQRRGYLARPSGYTAKIQRNQNVNRSKPPQNKALQSNNNSNFTIRLRNTPSKASKPTILPLYKIQTENGDNYKNKNIEYRQRCEKRNRKTSLMVHKNSRQLTEKQYQNDVASYRTPLNMVLYPIVNQGKKRKLFRKMDKFQNFVSVSLRK